MLSLHHAKLCFHCFILIINLFQFVLERCQYQLQKEKGHEFPPQAIIWSFNIVINVCFLSHFFIQIETKTQQIKINFVSIQKSKNKMPNNFLIFSLTAALSDQHTHLSDYHTHLSENHTLLSDWHTEKSEQHTGRFFLIL